MNAHLHSCPFPDCHKRFPCLNAECSHDPRDNPLCQECFKEVMLKREERTDAQKGNFYGANKHRGYEGRRQVPYHISLRGDSSVSNYV